LPGLFLSSGVWKTFFAPQLAASLAFRQPPRHRPAPRPGRARTHHSPTAAAQNTRTAPRAEVGPFRRPRLHPPPATRRRSRRFSEVRRPTPPALRRAPAPFVRRGRTAGGGRRATHPATEPRQSAPRLQTPSVRSPRPSVADHASPAWRAVAPRHAHPIGSPPMQMNSLRDSRRLRPSDPVPLPVFSLLTLSFPPSAFAQSGE